MPKMAYLLKKWHLSDIVLCLTFPISWVKNFLANPTGAGNRPGTNLGSPTKEPHDHPTGFPRDTCDVQAGESFGVDRSRGHCGRGDRICRWFPETKGSWLPIETGSGQTSIGSLEFRGRYHDVLSERGRLIVERGLSSHGFDQWQRWGVKSSVNGETASVQETGSWRRTGECASRPQEKHKGGT